MTQITRILEYKDVSINTTNDANKKQYRQKK